MSCLRVPRRHLDCTGAGKGAAEPIRLFTLRRVRARDGHRELQRRKLDTAAAHIVPDQERAWRGIPAENKRTQTTVYLTS